MINNILIHTKKGFSLLEVLIALIVLSIAFAAFYFSLSLTAKTLSTLLNKTAAQWVGLNVIAKAQLGVLTNSQTGTDFMFDQNWDWNLSISQTENSSISTITVNVSKANRNESIIKLEGFLSKN